MRCIFSSSLKHAVTCCLVNFVGIELSRLQGNWVKQRDRKIYLGLTTLGNHNTAWYIISMRCSRPRVLDIDINFVLKCTKCRCVEHRLFKLKSIEEKSCINHNWGWPEQAPHLQVEDYPQRNRNARLRNYWECQLTEARMTVNESWTVLHNM